MSNMKQITEQYRVSIRKRKRDQTFRYKRQSFDNFIPNLYQRIIIVDANYQKQILRYFNQEININQLNDVCELIDSQNLSDKTRGIISLRRLYCKNQKQLSEKIDNQSMFFMLFSLIDSQQNDQIVFQASWVLLNLLANFTMLTQYIIENDGVQKLIKLLHGSCKPIWLNIVLIFQNIFYQIQDFRQYCIDINLYLRLFELGDYAKTEDLVLFAQIITLLLMIVGQKRLIKFDVQSSILTKICSYLPYIVTNKDLLQKTLKTISYNVYGDDEKRYKFLFDLKIFNFLFNLIINEREKYIIISVLRIIGNISITQIQQIIQFFIQNGILEIINNLIKYNDKEITMNCCWILSNLVTQNQQTMKRIIKFQQLFKSIIYLFQHGQIQIKKQISFIFSNVVVSWKKPQTLFVLFRKIGLFCNYIQLLSCESNIIIKTIIERINILFTYFYKSGLLSYCICQFQKYHGVKKLLQLQTNGCQQAQQILLNFFEFQQQANGHELKIKIKQCNIKQITQLFQDQL